jgi:hypothetical protein
MTVKKARGIHRDIPLVCPADSPRGQKEVKIVDFLLDEGPKSFDEIAEHMGDLGVTIRGVDHPVYGWKSQRSFLFTVLRGLRWIKTVTFSDGKWRIA